MAKKMQRYIETTSPQAFDAIIGAQTQIGEYPFGDGHIPFVKMQTVDGDTLSVLPISTRFLLALNRWNRKHTPPFHFTIYISEDGGLLQQDDTQNHSALEAKKESKKKQRPPMRRCASMTRPHNKPA